ncbi:DNA mismatch repair protein MutS [Rubripirellula amarantea]|uniref:DNA mismatch repair protein MutS n=1 Tax=Rubripirellula amarantea TaxID=2527999 RepID=A0A5C5WRV9_9BACT|nr:DNA mismatch repair protein MutS [Rubripirellula amarantea]MDA8743019.1 DNA mismatch repair protein MutS [Rubripirellula amarantea]TWT53634.1 DNA mismatch repair protein MutS [Rubripirellula amarantea]
MTPMMKQYHEAKAACGDALLFFRMGDFYELFLDDAKVAAGILGLTLTSRDKDSDNPTAMAGFPHHQLDGYLHKLIRAGYRAAVCEQMEDPKTAKGLVKREVTRVVSAGTLTDDGLLDPRESNYVAAVCLIHDKKSGKTKGTPKTLAGIAWAELSSGRFEAGTFDVARIEDELARIGPAEVLYREDDSHFSPDTTAPWAWTSRPAWSFAEDTAKETLCKQFSVQSLDGFGFEDDDKASLRAAGAVLTYLQETQRRELTHFRSIASHRRTNFLQIDAATRRSLEITRTIRSGSREGSLLGVIDRTCTSMGSRLLGDWIAAPLIERDAIESRLDAISELVNDAKLRADIRDTLKRVFDLTRLMARIATQRTGPRDLVQVAQTLANLPALKARLTDRKSERLAFVEAHLHLCPELRSRLEKALSDECPINASEGNFIREGYDEELDTLRALAKGGKQWIAAYQKTQMDETGIPNIKVGYNKVFGFYLEVTNSHKDRVPDFFIRKQTLKNCERYITPELKEYEEKVLAADDNASMREQHLFMQLRTMTHNHLSTLQEVATAMAELDVLASQAEIAATRGWTRPVLTEDSVLRIEEGRHPVLDVTLPQGEFVPNDCIQSPEAGMIQLITGPNMAGKSTYIRQVALLTLMAQAGSFVPAKKAEIGIADRIFARVGASDELSRGQSTFMVEMVETARILNTATSRSLVILDEIGRGTSTYDGLSLAWAITEHLHEQIGCRTLFATHYHELTQLEETLPRVANLNVAVKEWNDEVIFLHRIVRGGADKSYGIHVARLAGIPLSVNERAKDVLAQLEADHRDALDRPTIQSPGASTSGQYQMTLFGFADHPLIGEVDKLDIDSMTPIEALQFLQSAKQSLRSAAAT